MRQARVQTYWAVIVIGVAVGPAFAVTTQRANAVPAFAQQTGQPCTACHIGAFGPQFTPLGRAFKIGGYTQTGGEGVAEHIPLAAMILGSFTHTNASQPEPAADHFSRNDTHSIRSASFSPAT